MNFIKNNITILMTGTINPNSFATLALKDPDIRRTQYIEAIKYYLEKTNFNIVFTENSGCSIEQEFENNKDKDRLEFLIYKSEPTIPDKGKGAKELEIINYAVNQSKFISESKAIIKITGRLKVLNINRLYKDFIKFNSKHTKMLTSNIYTPTKMDSRCFLFTKDFWPYLERFGKFINLKYSFEEALWNSGFVYMREGGNYKQFKRPISISGVSGGFGTPYDDSYMITLIKYVRHYFRAPYYYIKIKK